MIQEHALDAVIADVYEAPLRPDMWASVVGRIGDRLRGAGVVLGLIDLKRGGVLYTAVANIDLHYLALFHERYGAPESDPTIKGALSSPPMTIARRERFLSDRAFLRNEMCPDVLRPQNLWHSLGVKAHADDGSIAPLAIARRKSAGSFDADELRFLARLLPHINRALRLRQKLNVSIAERERRAARVGDIGRRRRAGRCGGEGAVRQRDDGAYSSRWRWAGGAARTSRCQSGGSGAIAGAGHWRSRACPARQRRRVRR
jgi:hypothetical protein